MDGMKEISRENGKGVTELRKISGDRRDWRRWTNTVSML
jgi:hypothetical protein